MHIKIKYFGQIAEITNTFEEQLDVKDALISDVLELLYSKYKGLKQQDFKVALNKKLVALKTPLAEGEIALLPPFSGG
jgi:molybdopterin synthase sulfur carrier subunit